MLGAIIGDIVGSRFEFNPTNDYDFELFTDQCGYTDDTICTVAVADALLKGKDFGESLHEWCNRYPCAMGGYGGRFGQWVRSSNPQPYGSFGNGSAMRVSPVAWYNQFEYAALHDAVESAVCTHNHLEGIKGALAVAYAIHDCRGYFRGKLPNDADRETLMKGLRRAIEFTNYDINIRKEEVLNKFDETCQGTVPVALWIISNSHSFEDAIRTAVSLGADADTLGAIVGSIAEVIWGIPHWMKEKALSYLPEAMQQVVKEFRKETHGKFPDVEQEVKSKREFFVKMYWKLALGNAALAIEGKDPLPSKEVVATADSGPTQPLPDDPSEVSQIKCQIEVGAEDMEILRKGHIPNAQEDHWFMYCDDSHIRYFRSWTGMCAYEAHFRKTDEGKFLIDHLSVNKRITEFGVNGDRPAQALFLYLLTAETGGNEERAWNDFINAWETNAIQYAK
jgi:ADP-ribosylglycohydrolase